MESSGSPDQATNPITIDFTESYKTSGQKYDDRIQSVGMVERLHFRRKPASNDYIPLVETAYWNAAMKAILYRLRPNHISPGYCIEGDDFTKFTVDHDVYLIMIELAPLYTKQQQSNKFHSSNRFWLSSMYMMTASKLNSIILKSLLISTMSTPFHLEFYSKRDIHIKSEFCYRTQHNTTVCFQWIV